MTDSNLPDDLFEEKPKRSQRRSLIAGLLAVLLVLGISIFLATPSFAPPPTPDVTGFDVQPYPTFSAPVERHVALTGTDDGFLALMNDQTSLTKIHFAINQTYNNPDQGSTTNVSLGVLDADGMLLVYNVETGEQMMVSPQSG